MQSCNITSCRQSTTVREFISQKTASFPSAWRKGRKLGFKDHQLMLGLKMTSVTKPGPHTYRHPISDRYVRFESLSLSGIKSARSAIESDFNLDFKSILQFDRLDAGQVVNRMLEYDKYMQQAVQDIPENVTIPEFFFDHSPDKKKPWLKAHNKTRDTLRWVAQNMMYDEECRPNSLTMLLAIWIELTNGMVMNKTNYTNSHAKPYFDWQQVFAYVEPSRGASAVVHTSSSAESRTSSATRSTRHSRKRKQMAAEVAHHGKRTITASTTARKIREQLESLENCIDDLEKTPRSLLESSERGDLAEKMLSVFTKLTKFPVRDDEGSDSSAE